MTLVAKQRLVVAGLAVLALWPIAHRALVVHAQLSPWRFFGWAMYCTPQLPVEVEMVARHGPSRTPLLLDELSDEVRRAADRLTDQRAVWGVFATSDHLARAVLESQPDADGVEIAVTHWYLDPATARIATRRYDYTYDR